MCVHELSMCMYIKMHDKDKNWKMRKEKKEKIRFRKNCLILYVKYIILIYIN